MKQIPIGDATTEQLRTFANDSLGLNLPPHTKHETLFSRVTSAWDKPEIPVADDTPAAEPPAGAPPRPVTACQQPPKKGYVRVHIAVTEDAGGNEPVPVGVNGKVMLVPRGKDVDIKEAYFQVLKNAIKHVYDPLPDGGMNPTPREVPLYPVQRVA